MIRRALQSFWPGQAVVAAGLLLSSPTFGQTNGSAGIFGASPPDARVQAAYEGWRRVSQTEFNCVDRSLRGQKASIRLLIQRGIGPADAAVANVRAGCRAQASAVTAAPAPNASQSTKAPTPSREYWSFNGSVLNSVAEGDSRTFYYLKPQSEVEAAGVHRGALLAEGKVLTFEGAALNRRFIGIAYHYDAHCGRVPYRVDGTIREGNHRLELQGQKPRLDAQCKVVGTDLASLTFKSIDPALAAEAASEKPAADKSAPDKAAADAKAAADKAAAENAAAQKAAAEKAAAEKAAAEKAAADKAAADKAAAEKAAAAKLAAEKIAAEKAAAEKAAAEKVAADKAAAERVAAEKAAAEKASSEKAAAERITAATTAADQIATNFSKADAERGMADAVRTQADDMRLHLEAARTTAEAAFASSAAESRISFIYGLITGPILFSLGGVVFLCLNRKKSVPEAQPKTSALDYASLRNRSGFDRSATAAAAGRPQLEGKYRPDAAAGLPKRDGTSVLQPNDVPAHAPSTPGARLAAAATTQRPSPIQ